MSKTDEIIEKTVRQTILSLKKEKMISSRCKSTYQKTEQLLYNYKNFKQLIEDKELQIKSIKEDGVPKCSDMSEINIMTHNRKNDYEKSIDIIDNIEHSIKLTKTFINLIDQALDSLKTDIYYDIIPMIYFDNLSRGEVAQEFNCDEKTITRNKSRLVNKLEIRLFADEFIYQLFS